MSRERIFDGINSERNRQDEQWGGVKHDSRNGAYDWTAYVLRQLSGVHGAVARQDVAECRRRWVKVAALAVAALEMLPDAPNE